LDKLEVDILKQSAKPEELLTAKINIVIKDHIKFDAGYGLFTIKPIRYHHTELVL